MTIKLLKKLEPSDSILKLIDSTNPEQVKITNGRIDVLEPTNVETIIPVKYLLVYPNKIVEFYEYPDEHIKGNNLMNYKTKKTFNKNELKNYIINY